MAKRPTRSKKPELTSSTGGVVVGWTHHDLGTSNDLRIQSVESKQALDSNDIDSRHFLMTHNQALLLAKYLLDATGQKMPQRQKTSIWQRMTRKQIK